MDSSSVNCSDGVGFIRGNNSMEDKTSLEQFPEHLQAIGMISIENGRLEIALAGLFGVILRVSKNLSHAIYFTPRAAALRIGILEASAKVKFATQKDIFNKIRGLAKRSRNLIQKRHDIIHDAWIVGQYHHEKSVTNLVIKIPTSDFATFDKMEIIELKELKVIIDDFRILIDEIYSFSSSLRPSRKTANRKSSTNS